MVEREVNRVTASVTVHLNSNSDGKPAVDLVGNPPSRARGTGSQRVDKEQPVPLPQHFLPVTRAGFETRDIDSGFWLLMYIINYYPGPAIDLLRPLRFIHKPCVYIRITKTWSPESFQKLAESMRLEAREFMFKCDTAIPQHQ